MSRRLASAGLNARVPAAKPLIPNKNQNALLKFATKYVVWTEDQWSIVNFTVESKFNVLCSVDRKYVRKMLSERLSVQCVKKIVKHGGECVMVRGSSLLLVLASLIHLHRKVNREVYKQILRQHAFHMWSLLEFSALYLYKIKLYSTLTRRSKFLCWWRSWYDRLACTRPGSTSNRKDLENNRWMSTAKKKQKFKMNYESAWYLSGAVLFHQFAENESIQVARDVNKWLIIMDCSLNIKAIAIYLLK